MSIVKITSRNINGVNLKADWSKIDSVIEDIKNKDTNKEIDAIGFVRGDIYDGELLQCAVFVAIGKEVASFELYQAINNSSVAFEKEDRIPSDFLEIWRRTKQ